MSLMETISMCASFGSRLGGELAAPMGICRKSGSLRGELLGAGLALVLYAVCTASQHAADAPMLYDVRPEDTVPVGVDETIP